MRSGFRVVDAMTVRPVVASPHANIHEIARLMERHDVGSIIVKQGDEVLGMITESDIVRRGILEGYDLASTRVEKLMTRDLITISPGADLFDAILLMRDTEVRTLPVVDEGKMVGFVTAKDVLKLQPELFDNLVDSIDLREEEHKLRRKQHVIDYEDE